MTYWLCDHWGCLGQCRERVSSSLEHDGQRGQQTISAPETFP